MSNRWILNSDPIPRTQYRLFFFPPAGRGASMYAKWSKGFPPGLHVCPVQLPGRENRLRETPFTSMSSLLETLIPALENWFDVPFVFFGHSMGAIIGFELARELRKQGLNEPVHLFVSARRPPHLKEPHPPIAHWPESAFLEEVQRRYGGIPEAVFQDSEMRDLILPTLRADFSLLEQYEYWSGPPLSYPITAFGGSLDLDVSKEELEGWREHTTHSFQLQLLPGDHFFLLDTSEEVIRLVMEAMGEVGQLPSVRVR